MRQINCWQEEKFLWSGRCLIIVILATLVFVFADSRAFAHKVTIFAWVDGDTVHTVSKFSGGKRAQNSEVIVLDTRGNQLLEGKTNENGEFSFKIPQKTDLKIVLKASMGHMAYWTVPAEEINQVPVSSKESGAVPMAQAAEKTSSAATGAKTGPKAPAPATHCLKSQVIKTIIDESLDRKLTPVMNMLASSIDHGPKMTEIIGGIGYIFGLVGVALYFANRRKKE